MLFDAHTHVHFPAYDADREAVIARARAAGVKMITVGTQAASSRAAIALAEIYPNDVWATAGFHPAHASLSWYHDRKEQANAQQETFDAAALRELARQEKVVAIGECGLDYYRLPSDKEEATPKSPANGTLGQASEKEKQKEVFLSQAEIAREIGKPLMIHCRPSKGTDDAYEDLLNILTTNDLRLTTVVHFYVGSTAVTKKLAAAGFYFTFGGVITFTRDYDEPIKFIPLDRILLETDAPYVAPMPYRGKRNEPAYLIETAKKMAEIKGIGYDELVETTTATAKSVFGI